MAERDYKVVYRSREIDRERDDDRSYTTGSRRIPGALDPYDYPEDRDELKRNVGEARVRAARKYIVDARGDEASRVERERGGRDGYSVASTREREGGSRRTRYEVRDEREDVRGVGSVVAPSRAGVTSVRERDRDVEIDRREYGFSRGAVARGDAVYSSRYELESPRRESGGAYVVEVRRGDDVEVVRGGRGPDSYRGSVYEGSQVGRRSAPSVREIDTRRSDYARDSPRSSRSAFRDDGPYASGARVTDERIVVERDVETRTTDRGPMRSSTRLEEDDWKFVERRTSTRTPSVHESVHDRGRSRVSGNRSEDDFVVVSPQRDGMRSPRSETALRSAFFRADQYSPEERRERRRSRSISFREKECVNHDAGEQMHQRPGAEGVLAKGLLPHFNESDGQEKFDYEYRDVIRRDPRRSVGRYEQVDRYPPQRSHRSRSRRRRKEEESDDESYVSRKVEKTTKYTYY